MALKFSMILEAIDRASAPARRAQSAISRLTTGVRRWGQDVRRVSSDITSGSRSIEHYERRARRLRQVALGTFFRAASEQARRFNSNLRAGIRSLDLMGRAGRGARSGLKWLGGTALGAAKWATAGAAGASGLALFDLFKTGGQFEQYQVALEGTEGSAKAARKAMQWVQKFAQDTPYELDQVMEAFIALKAYGIDPMNGSLMSLGDGASGMSKPIGQAVEALADAVTGEYERLKEFGIRASKEGDKVTFTYRKNGKDIQRTVKATGTEIEKTITGIFSDRFGGGMARQSKTLFGIISNIKDMWNGFLLMVANAGIFDKVKAGLDRFRARVDAMSKNGKLQEWAQRISDNLGKAWDWAVKFAEETDWERARKDLVAIADAAITVARAIASIGETYQKYKWVQDFNPLTGGLIGNWIRRSNETPAVQVDGEARPRDVARGRSRPPGSPPTAPASGAGRWHRLPAGERRTPATSAAKIGGVLDVNVKVQGPATASVARVTTVNRAVPINAKVGKVMGGPA